jgi:predicted nucleotide-binding protein (sugar kinase/HSP70/actin superfamily)
MPLFLLLTHTKCILSNFIHISTAMFPKNHKRWRDSNPGLLVPGFKVVTSDVIFTACCLNLKIVAFLNCASIMLHRYLHYCNWVARWYIFVPKIPFWVSFGTLWKGMENIGIHRLWPFGIYHSRCVYFMDTWSPLGIFFPVLVYRIKKNLATINCNCKMFVV